MPDVFQPPDPTRRLDAPRFPRASVMVRQWTDATPDRIAVSRGESGWSYRRLRASGDEIGDALRRTGVGPGDVVAVCGPRCFGLVAGVLAVLSSEGVLLPVDPKLPPERVAAMLGRVNVRCVIHAGPASTPLEAMVPAAATIRIDDEGRILEERAPRADGAPPRPSAAGARGRGAYLFFTSGSTGEPKAVLGSHEGLSHFLAWQAATFSVSPPDRVAQLTNLSFDVVLRDILLPLVSGATLVLPPDVGAEGMPHVLGWLRDERISLLHAVPTLTRFWMERDGGTTILPDLRVVFFAGEPLTADLVARWRGHGTPAMTVVNLYGPTETTLAKFWARVDDAPGHGILPVGHPLPATQALVVSDAGDLLGVGEVGEIVIRTPFATLGYVGETPSRSPGFRPNPWSDDPGDVVYHTGDLGRYRADGMLEVLGRRDRQVKILGVRVDPAEVEAELALHPSVRHGVVTPVLGSDGAVRLTGYVKGDEGERLSASEIRRFLSRRLPQAMVPSSIVVVPDIPRTPSGKVDYAALSRVGRAEDVPAQEPKDELDARLLELWQRVFPDRPPQLTDDFFELGGTSLLAARLFADIEATFGRALPLATLFEAPRPTDLADVIRRHNWLAPWSSLVPLRTGGTQSPLFYIHPGGGNLLVYRNLALGAAADRPVYGLQPRGLDGIVDPFRTIEEMAAHYVALVVGVQPEGAVHLAGLSSGGLIALEMAQRLRESGRDVAFLGMIDTTGPGGYRPLPLPLRVVSVIRWVVADRLGHFAAAVRRRLAAVRRGDRSPRPAPAAAMPTAPRRGDAVEKSLMLEKRQNILDKRLALFRSSRRPGPGKLVDSLLIDLLRRSSRPFFAGVLAEGVVRTPPEGTTPHGRWIQELGDHASRVYVPRPYDGPITYFQARCRPPGLRTHRMAGWAAIAVGDFELHEVSGDHGSIIRSPELGPLLEQCLKESEGRSDDRRSAKAVMPGEVG